MSPRTAASLPAESEASLSAKAAADPRAAMRRLMERNTSSASAADGPSGGTSKLNKAQRKELRSRSASMAATLQTLSEKRETMKRDVETTEITLDDLDDEHLGQTLAEFDELSDILPSTDVDADLAATTIVHNDDTKENGNGL